MYVLQSTRGFKGKKVTITSTLGNDTGIISSVNAKGLTFVPDDGFTIIVPYKIIDQIIIEK
jgi:hypothetical protein